MVCKIFNHLIYLYIIYRMRCNEKFHEIIKNETEEQYCPICSQDMDFNDECQIVYLKEYDVCCDCQDIIRNFGKFVCRSCGIVQGYEPAREFIDFYDNRHRIRRKSVYHRKYHINDILMRISMNHKIEISVENKTKIMRIFNEIGGIIPKMESKRKRMISINFILRQVLRMMGLPCEKIPISKTKKTLNSYQQYWDRIMLLIGDRIKRIIDK